MKLSRLFALLLLALPGPAVAAESAAHVSPRATVTLVSDTDAVDTGAPYHLGLRFKLAPGWHTYGRNPGDAGIPPDFKWTVPDHTKVGDIDWPTPLVLPEGPVTTYGYTGTVLLAAPAEGAGPVRLHASWLVCDNICVPEEGNFTLELPAGTAAPSSEAALFAEARANTPRPSPFAAHIGPNGTMGLSGAGLGAGAVREAWFMPDQPDMVVPAAAQTLGFTTDGITLHLAPGEAFKANASLSGVLVLRDASGQNTALAVTATPGAVSEAMSLWRALGFAVLGGLILNLMPCVFPVLAMKAMAIARLSVEDRFTARAHAGIYTVGVMASFAVIGAAVQVLRQLGHAVGWGFQFQSPVFVAVMAWLLFAIGLNLSGVFQVDTRLAGTGQSLTLRDGWAGSLFSGVLAVLVASPCTAPFMGLALASALAAPPVQSMLVFLALGAGLAAPTTLLAVLPGVARLLPRPGRWMEILKQALAFPMYGAAAWLVWVLSLQAGGDGVLAVVVGLVLVGFAAWALRFGPRWGAALAVTAVVAALALLPGLSSAELPQLSAAESGPSERFSTARLDALRAAGKPVFVNMTAAWCVTCLVNEKVALSPPAVRAAFAAAGVTLLTGDWTRQDAEISAFLQAQAHDGVPLYLFYPPDGRPPVVLPQILTPGIVLAALQPYAKAGRP